MYILTTSNLNINETINNEINAIDANFGPLCGFVIYIWCLTFILIYMLYKFTNLPTYIKSKCV